MNKNYATNDIINFHDLEIVAQKLKKIHDANNDNDVINESNEFNIIQNMLQWRIQAKELDNRTFFRPLYGSLIDDILKMIPKSAITYCCHNGYNKPNVPNDKPTVGVVSNNCGITNFAEFDIANYICNINIVYTKEYPYFEYVNLNENIINDVRYTFCKNYLEQKQKKIIDMCNKIKLFECVCNIYWALWAIIKHYMDDDKKLDYISYAKLRMHMIEKCSVYRNIYM